LATPATLAMSAFADDVGDVVDVRYRHPTSSLAASAALATCAFADDVGDVVGVRYRHLQSDHP
jgi:hypothetical protein